MAVTGRQKLYVYCHNLHLANADVKELKADIQGKGNKCGRCVPADLRAPAYPSERIATQAKNAMLPVTAAIVA